MTIRRLSWVARERERQEELAELATLPPPPEVRPIRTLDADDLFAAALAETSTVCSSGREPYDLDVMDQRPPRFTEGRTKRRRR